jgi:hypothetical protein
MDILAYEAVRNLAVKERDNFAVLARHGTTEAIRRMAQEARNFWAGQVEEAQCAIDDLQDGDWRCEALTAAERNTGARL